MGSRRGRGGGYPDREGCSHTTALIVPTADGNFYGRCLVCGKVGPERQSSEAARRALLADASGGDVGDGDDEEDQG